MCVLIEKHANITEVPTLCSIIETAAVSQPEGSIDGNAIVNSADLDVVHHLGKYGRTYALDDGKCRSHCAILITQGDTDLQKSARNAISHQPPLRDRR